MEPGDAGHNREKRGGGEKKTEKGDNMRDEQADVTCSTNACEREKGRESRGKEKERGERERERRQAKARKGESEVTQTNGCIKCAYRLRRRKK